PEKYPLYQFLLTAALHVVGIIVNDLTEDNGVDHRQQLCCRRQEQRNIDIPALRFEVFPQDFHARFSFRSPSTHAAFRGGFSLMLGDPSACVRMWATTSSTESVNSRRSMSSGLIVFSSIMRCTWAMISLWKPTPITTIGNRFILPVWMRVSVSKNSSNVPKPPGNTMNAKEYLRSNSLRTKKYSMVTNRSRYGLWACSWGSTMLQPTERAPPSLAPRFAASMMPGPPPVMMAKPSLPISADAWRASS